MKLLVTGGAGFIGSHLLELLNSDKNYEVVVLDNLSSGFRENVPQGMRLVVADIRSQEIEALFQKENFDAVVHLAAQTMVPYSIEHPDEDCEINLAGLINVLENCRKYKVKTVLFASSAAVYGNNEIDANVVLWYYKNDIRALFTCLPRALWDQYSCFPFCECLWRTSGGRRRRWCRQYFL